MRYDDVKLQGLFSRILNEQQTTKEDVSDLKAYIKKVFGDGSVTPDPSLLHQFNNLVVREADKLVKPEVTQMIGLLADFRTSPLGQLVQYEIPQNHRAKVVWAAHGTGVDLHRVEGQRSKVAVPQKFQTGFYYEPLSLSKEEVEFFRQLVRDVADAKLRLYMENIAKTIQTAIASSTIPTNNTAIGNNLSLTDYNKVASTLARYGGRPVFIGDTLLIDYFAMQQATNPTFEKLLTDDIRNELLTSLNPATIGRTVAVNLVNPFTDETNSKTELPVNEGYMFPSGRNANAKPFKVIEYGGLRQLTEQDIEDERIKLKLTQEAAIELVFPEIIGYVREDAAVSL